MEPSKIWEIDFYSRPLLDERGKRVWELLACDSHGTYKRSSYCANTQATTPWVAAQLQEWIDEAPVRPTTIRAFRERIKTILARSCDKIGVPFKLTRRVFALASWMQQRAKEVYPNEPEYRYEPEAIAIPIEMEREAPNPLPDALQPDRWALVTLRVRDMREAGEWPRDFGELFSAEWDRFDPDTIVPGLLLFSSRAKALAAWMTGVEPVFLKAYGGQQAGLVLESGASDRDIVARFNSEATRAEGEGFERRKLEVRGLHFLGIQADPRSQSFSGLWLLREIDLT
ncbi:Tab2/Atab2 family RNA-binding protein [Synechococcus sp. PCC 7336]|uniref:Tab2/Atab2 family RNA-binding protein n=1 Tax=Synechococcus sp. PCC 7336 TaxID=195250 RepID=UPI0003465FCC|nr:Tab2/Atab2 family RNA-binding protein [Synechococcus sp. PCC 7336]